MTYRVLLFLFLLGLLAPACRHFDDLEGLETRGDGAEYAIPLINTSVSMGDLLEKLDKYTYIDTDSTGLIYLRYKGEVVTKTSQEIFQNIQLALPPLVPVLDTTMILPFNTPDGIEIDYVEVKTGEIQYYFASPHPDVINVNVRFPQAYKPNGQPLEFNHVVGPMGFVALLVPYNLTGHKLIADDEGNLRIEYTATRSNGERDTVSNFFITMTNFTFSYAEGYFGNQLHDGGRDTIFIEFFESWTKGNVYFEDPKIFVNVSNSFGVPTRSIVNVFDIFTADGQLLPVQSDAIGNGIDFAYPKLPNEIGQTKNTSFSFTKDNSNIDEVLGSRPIALDYDVDAITNPDNVTAIRGFITDSSRYAVSVEVELPIYGRSSAYTVIDTVDVDFASYVNLKEMEFKVFVENFLPLNVDIQAYFQNENGQVIDSLLAAPKTLIAAAPVDDQGEIIAPANHVLYIPVAGARLDNLRAARRIILNAAFSTYNNGAKSAKVYADQKVNIGVGLRLKYKD